LPSVEQLLALPRQRLDSAGARLPRALIANAQSHHAQFSRIAGRLGPHVLRARITRCCEVLSALMERGRRADGIAQARRAERLRNATTRLAVGLRANADAHRARIIRVRERVTSLAERGERAIQQLLAQRAASLEHRGQLLNALSHRGVLERGFALIRISSAVPCARRQQSLRGWRWISIPTTATCAPPQNSRLPRSRSRNPRRRTAVAAIRASAACSDNCTGAAGFRPGDDE
jgi:exodeoxyribonuclease VII large subunit